MEWKQINDCPNYKINNTGQVVNIKTGKTIKGSIDKLGYPYVYLRDINGKPKIKKIHRLLGELFIPNPDNKPEIDHINTDKSDFRLENLRWVTREENCNNPTTLEHKRGKKHNITKPYKPKTQRKEKINKQYIEIETLCKNVFDEKIKVEELALKLANYKLLELSDFIFKLWVKKSA